MTDEIVGAVLQANACFNLSIILFSFRVYFSDIVNIIIAYFHLFFNINFLMCENSHTLFDECVNFRTSLAFFTCLLYHGDGKIFF